MTVEYLPVGIACNISCKYCYQDPMRDAGNINVPRQWPKVKEVLTRYGTDFSVFGGEPLLTPIDHLREVFEFGYSNFGKNGIQTNGSLITDEHIALFQEFNVHVGISIDGPRDMNLVRCSLTLTDRTERAIDILCAANRPPSLIITIHKGNNDLQRLVGWLTSLQEQGIRSFNFHELEVECGKEHIALSEDRNIETFLELYEWSKKTNTYASPFIDIQKLLTTENPNVSCVWNACDPLTTAAVQGVNPDGVMSNCGRTNKDGINWVKADTPGTERYLSLYYTPQEYGGCRGCKYFAFCKGHCPGTAINGDWRNRTVNCKLWYTLFERIAQDNTCLSPEIVKRLEQRLITSNTSHGDVPHGDSHGDHTDYGVRATVLGEKPSWVS